MSNHNNVFEIDDAVEVEVEVEEVEEVEQAEQLEEVASVDTTQPDNVTMGEEELRLLKNECEKEFGLILNPKQKEEMVKEITDKVTGTVMKDVKKVVQTVSKTVCGHLATTTLERINESEQKSEKKIENVEGRLDRIEQKLASSKASSSTVNNVDNNIVMRLWKKRVRDLRDILKDNTGDKMMDIKRKPEIVAFIVDNGLQFS